MADEKKLEMSDQRKLEIAMRALRYIMRKQGVHLSGNTAREIQNVAKAIEVPVEELCEFARPLVQDLIDESFGTKFDEAWRHGMSRK